jgi:plasmid stabilization system protein ParE
MSYRVELAEVAESAIWEQAQFIAAESGFPQRAAEWVQRCLDAVATLEDYPYRCALALGSDRRDFDTRKLNFGPYIILFHIDQAAKMVHVIGFRHGMRDTPGTPAGEDV